MSKTEWSHRGLFVVFLWSFCGRTLKTPQNPCFSPVFATTMRPRSDHKKTTFRPRCDHCVQRVWMFAGGFRVPIPSRDPNPEPRRCAHAATGHVTRPHTHTVPRTSPQRPAKFQVTRPALTATRTRRLSLPANIRKILTCMEFCCSKQKTRPHMHGDGFSCLPTGATPPPRCDYGVTR